MATLLTSVFRYHQSARPSAFLRNGALLILISLSLICDGQREGAGSGKDHTLDISMPDVRPTQVSNFYDLS